MPAPKDPEKRKLWLARVSACQIGRIPWNKGLKGAQKSCRKGITMEEEYGAKRAEQIKLKQSKAHMDKILTEEHKRHIGEAFTGEKHWMFGKHHSKKSRIKISRTLKKNPVRYWKGKHLGKKTKKKLSRSHKGLLAGQNHPMWGKHHTEIAKEKISLANKGRRPWNAGKPTGLIPWNKGVPWNEEMRQKLRTYRLGTRLTENHKKKISKALKGRPSSLKGRKLSKEHIKNSLRRRIPSSLEQKFQKILKKYHLPYRYTGDGSFIIGNCNPDFVNADGKKIAIEVFARFYKQMDDRNIKDWQKERMKLFRQYGWRIFFFDETEVREDYILKTLKIRGCQNC